MTYQLWFNDHRININDNNTMNETFVFKLKRLEPFMSYIITVVACTSFCSDSSDSLSLRTKIGVPGAMFQPKLKALEADEVNIAWEAPEVLGGNLDYFQLRLITSDEFGKVQTKSYRIDGRLRSCYIKGFKCGKDKIDFSMRSVNVENPDTMKNLSSNRVDCLAFLEPIQSEISGQFYGGWSQPYIFYCQKPLSATMIIGCLLLFFIMALSGCMLNKVYKKYQEMKDIHIIWPKGLDPNSPLSSPSKAASGVRDLDLLKDHTLTAIEEEDELMEREKFLPEDSKQELSVVTPVPVTESHRESFKNEIFLPFIRNPKTNEIIYQLPTMSKPKEKFKSAPTSPAKVSDYAEFTSDPNIDLNTGYTKMFAPERSRSESSSTVEGYLDMSGKAANSPVPEARQNNYTTNEISMFIQDSELNNNGYIGKRASILSDPEKKHPQRINSNGYVGLHT